MTPTTAEQASQRLLDMMFNAAKAASISTPDPAPANQTTHPLLTAADLSLYGFARMVRDGGCVPENAEAIARKFEIAADKLGQRHKTFGKLLTAAIAVARSEAAASTHRPASRRTTRTSRGPRWRRCARRWMLCGRGGGDDGREQQD